MDKIKKQKKRRIEMGKSLQEIINTTVKKYSLEAEKEIENKLQEKRRLLAQLNAPNDKSLLKLNLSKLRQETETLIEELNQDYLDICVFNDMVKDYNIFIMKKEAKDGK
jgi:hypothetical protein